MAVDPWHRYSNEAERANQAVNDDFKLGKTFGLLPGMTGPPNSFTARGPVTLTAILFPQPAV